MHRDKIREAMEEEALKRAAASVAGQGTCPAGPHPVDECNRVPSPGGIQGTEQIGGTFGRGEYRVRLAEQAEKSAAYHREVAEKQEAAARFFYMHPEFEEFIRLIRSGAITLYG